jgi:hypothetical protein
VAKLARSLTQSYNTRLGSDLLAALKLYHWLKANPVGLKPELSWRAPIYRVTYGDFDPLSVAGSLSDGGRLNIGGAQQLPLKAMPGIRKAACLYGASSIQCALKEAADPIGRYRIFRITPKSECDLWDLGAILSTTSYPNLKARIDATPMSQTWALQKSPLESQILAHHLRDTGGKGIVYDSQKDPGAKVLAFFLLDDQEAHRTFDVIEEKV